jgi:hypothetical protein
VSEITPLEIGSKPCEGLHHNQVLTNASQRFGASTQMKSNPAAAAVTATAVTAAAMTAAAMTAAAMTAAAMTAAAMTAAAVTAGTIAAAVTATATAAAIAAAVMPAATVAGTEMNWKLGEPNPVYWRVFLVEDIEGRQADVRDFFFAKNYRWGVLRGHIANRTWSGRTAWKRQGPSDCSQRCNNPPPTSSLLSLI